VASSAQTPRVRRYGRALLAGLTALVILGSCASPALAAGVGNSFSELTERAEQAQTNTTPTTATTPKTVNESNPHNSTTVLVLGGAAAFALLGAIAFIVVRDARRAAPVADPDFVEGRPASDPAVRIRKRRAKAKAARRQRKRNR
jgi:hypothetical protein